MSSAKRRMQLLELARTTRNGGKWCQIRGSLTDCDYEHSLLTSTPKSQNWAPATVAAMVSTLSQKRKQLCAFGHLVCTEALHTIHMLAVLSGFETQVTQAHVDEAPTREQNTVLRSTSNCRVQAFLSTHFLAPAKSGDHFVRVTDSIATWYLRLFVHLAPWHFAGGCKLESSEISSILVHVLLDTRGSTS